MKSIASNIQFYLFNMDLGTPLSNSLKGIAQSLWDDYDNLTNIHIHWNTNQPLWWSIREQITIRVGNQIRLIL